MLETRSFFYFCSSSTFYCDFFFIKLSAGWILFSLVLPEHNGSMNEIFSFFLRRFLSWAIKLQFLLSTLEFSPRLEILSYCLNGIDLAGVDARASTGWIASQTSGACEMALDGWLEFWFWHLPKKDPREQLFLSSISLHAQLELLIFFSFLFLFLLFLFALLSSLSVGHVRNKYTWSCW
jgi:hypothetical protein